MEFSNNRSVSSNKEVFNPINELYDGGMSKLMTDVSYSYIQCGSIPWNNIIYMYNI